MNKMEGHILSDEQYKEYRKLKNNFKEAVKEDKAKYRDFSYKIESLEIFFILMVALVFFGVGLVNGMSFLC